MVGLVILIALTSMFFSNKSINIKCRNTELIKQMIGIQIQELLWSNDASIQAL